MFNNIIYKFIIGTILLSTACFASTEQLRVVDFITEPANSFTQGKIFNYKNICSICYHPGKEMHIVPYGSVITAVTPILMKVDTVKEFQIHHHAAEIIINDVNYMLIVSTAYKSDNKPSTQSIGLWDPNGEPVDIVKAGFVNYLVDQNANYCKELEKLGAPKEHVDKLINQIKQNTNL